jgi:tetratricopeptide (TPR) repeat protein
MGKQRFWLIGIAILVGAFVLRLAYLLQVKDLPFYYHPILDAGFFQRWAAYKQHVSWLEAGVPFRQPLYAYFLAVIFAGLRDSLNLVRVIQCALGGLTALLVYWIGRRLYGLLAGVIAGGLFAVCIPGIFFASELDEVTLTLLLLTAAAYLVVRAADAKPYLNLSLSGLLVGGAFLANFTAIAAVPAWLAASLGSGNRRVRKATPVMVIGLLVAPLCYHLFLAGGDQRAIMPLRASWQAFLGSTTAGEAGKGWYEISIAGPDGAYTAIAQPDRIEGQRDAARFAVIEDSTATTARAAAGHWQARVLDDFAAGPLGFVKTYLTRLGLFWGKSEPPSNLGMRFLSRYSALLKTPVFSFGVIAALGLAGLALGTRRRSLHLTVFVVLFSLFAALFIVTDTLKVMVVPFLCVFGGYLVSEVLGRFRQGRAGGAAALIAAAAVAGLVVGLLPAVKTDEVANLVAVGGVYGEVAMFDRAEDFYREAIEADPARPEPYASLAGLYSSTGKAQAGLELLAAAQNRGIEDPRIGIEMASLLIMTGRQQEAMAELDRVKRTYPYEPRLHQLMGLALLDMGKPDLALIQLRKESDYVGGGFITYSALGRAEYETGDYEEAARYLEAALSFNPYNAPASVQLADTYSKLGQHLKACEVLGKILAVDPGNMPLRFKLANCLYRADRPQDALRHFKELEKYDPGNADILVNMGTVYAGMDSLEKAVEVWKRALVLDPGNEMARENLDLAEHEHE